MCRGKRLGWVGVQDLSARDGVHERGDGLDVVDRPEDVGRVCARDCPPARPPARPATRHEQHQRRSGRRTAWVGRASVPKRVRGLSRPRSVSRLGRRVVRSISQCLTVAPLAAAIRSHAPTLAGPSSGAGTGAGKGKGRGRGAGKGTGVGRGAGRGAGRARVGAGAGARARKMSGPCTTWPGGFQREGGIERACTSWAQRCKPSSPSQVYLRGQSW